jgi:Terminase large subunit, T4likevirus-type, N-terminal
VTQAAAARAPDPGKVRLKFRTKLTRSQWRAWQSESRWTALLGGWGSGKTFTGARVFLRNLTANPAGVDGLIVAPFWGTMHRTTLREFRAVVPRKLITHESKKERYIEVLGRRAYYGSADAPETLDGPTVGAIWIDEGRYLSRKAWQVVFTRLRSARATRVRGFISSTPGGQWLEEEFNTGRPERLAVHSSTRENREHLAAGTIEDMETSLSARAAKVFLDGAVYDFDKNRHLVKWRYDPKLPVWLAWDFGFTRPAVLFLQPVPVGTVLSPAKGVRLARAALPGTWVVFDELVPDGISTEQLAAQVQTKGYRIAGIWCDPAGDGTQPALGISDVTTVKAAGLPQPKWVIEPRLRHIPFGVRTVEAMLCNVRGETRIYVADQLDRPQAKRGVVKDFGRYRYPEAKDGRAVSDQPHKDGLTDHTMDALRYFAVGQVVGSGQAPTSIRTG